jgi:uncharacterized protein (DUF58 family)
MIAPSKRLLIAVAMLFLPCGLMAAAWPGWTPFLVSVMLAVAFVAAWDASRASQTLHGISVSFTSPTQEGEEKAVFRFSRHREGELTLYASKQSPQPRSLRLGLALPAVFSESEETMPAFLEAGQEVTILTWPCTPLERGRFEIGPIYMDTPSLWGLWRVRRSFMEHAEARVYPNLLSERNRFAGLFLRRGSLGIHAQRQLGKGRDFEQLREYIPGDGYEDIHWKATARRGRPITKTYQVERTQEVYVAIDASRLSARHVVMGDEENIQQLDRFITSAMILGLAAEQQGDLYGVCTFSDRIHSFVRSGNGSSHHHACRDALYTLTPRRVNPDFEEFCTFVRLRLRRRSLLVILTNLDDPVLAESFAAQCELLSRRHLVFVYAIVPPHVRPLFEEPAENKEAVYQDLAGHLQWRGLRDLQRTLSKRGVTLCLSDSEDLAHQVVSQYMAVKQRQVL